MCGEHCLCIPSLSSYVHISVSILTWCPLDEVQKYLSKRTEEIEETYNACLERQRWRQHTLFAEKKEILETKCKKNGLECSGGKHLLVKRLPYLPVYKSTFQSLKIGPKNRPRLIHGSKTDIKKCSGQISITIVSCVNKHPLLHGTSYDVFSQIDLSSSRQNALRIIS